MRQFRGIVENPYAPSTDMLWLNDNELKYFSNGEWKTLYNKPKDTSVSTSNTLKYITLEEGNTKESKASNLDILSNSDTIYIKIGEGIGVYNWNPKLGGQAHIITAYGNTVYYTITKDGKVSKGLETPDIFLEYSNSGGTKSSKEFIRKLVQLINK